ncbi:hypothetical protein KG089_01925 [Carnobacteriaceae bacterium zg-ZUI252]|nr:hypothetical protein [Carnobacteriaceae bacterium zg-ZUI252]MBS4770577.1 hypothetical protein [Carnobacteriaceae bacterium zg-ZUI240]
MSINVIIAILFGLSALLIIISLFLKNTTARELEELKDYSFEQAQEIYKLRERVSSLETFTGLPMTQVISFTSEYRNLTEMTKKNIIGLYHEGRTAEEISLFANIPLETVQILIDRYIADSTK